MRRSLTLALILAFAACEEAPPPASRPPADRPRASTPRTDRLPTAGSPPADASRPAPADAAAPAPVPRVCAPAPALARLLTRAEYDATVRDLLGDGTSPAADLPAENRVLGFDNNAGAHQATPVLVEGYLDAAERVAARAVQRGVRDLAGCDPSSAGCAADWVEGFGRRAFRRPLSDGEQAVFIDLFDAVSAEADAATGIQAVLTALLQSPQFLYRLDGPGGGEVEGAPVPLGDFAVASRLSYFLWGTTPDDALLDAASGGGLGTRGQIEAVARRMLDDPRAREAVARFHRQWLGLDALDGLVKDSVEDQDALRAGLRTSIERFLDAAFWDEGTVAALLGSPVVFVDAALGAELGIAGGRAGAFVPVELPGERAGLLTQPALLARLAHPDQTSPIRRGIFVREVMLCQPLPPPPAEVVGTVPDPDPTATTRERFAQHTADPVCQGCHQRIDPVGFGFEGFDEVGRSRTTENGLPIDTRGSLIGPPDRAIAGPFDGAVELAGRLAGSPSVRRCIARQWFRYAMARVEQAPDACALDAIHEAFDTSDGSLRALLVAIAVSDAFLTRPGEAMTAPAPLPPLADDPGEPLPAPGDADLGRAPVGVVDGVDAVGWVRGWAFDPDAPEVSVTLELWLDGAPGAGQFLAAARTGLERPDVNAAHPDAPGDHGFSTLLPEVARDGRDHALTVVALGLGAEDADTVLGGSPVAFRAGLNAERGDEVGVPDAHRPQGFLDVVRPDGQICGWALDQDVTDRPVEVDLWVDGPAGVDGVHAGTAQTGLDRPDVVNAIGHPGRHGWCFALPAALHDGRPHAVGAYAFEAGHPGSTVLTNSPFAFTLEASP